MTNAIREERHAMTNAILRGKPDAGNPHVRFDEGEVASAKPRRGSLLYKRTFPLIEPTTVSISQGTTPGFSLSHSRIS